MKQSTYKGQYGTILVIGGSDMYTGAPIFVTKAAFRSGAEMVYVMVPSNDYATKIIKEVHEAIVTDLLFDLKILKKINACVIGPGLGRMTENTLSTILKIVEFFDKNNIWTVLDADIIHYYKKGIFNNFSKIILTPNHNENINLVVKSHHFCLLKGKADILFMGNKQIKSLLVQNQCIKRCCGLGDMLCGIIAAHLCFSEETIEKTIEKASIIAKKAAYSGFVKKYYGIKVTDIIEEIPQFLGKN
ncbi:ATP-dependent (S)-NAD(P)H-hydrate dehydratase [Ecytonucleospora hepatopenaei]|uniref:ATP-dependent (S)-NAD(P)H-hydrate dehydratase n=1 Tax=Ecytonucleospora hepatopenaei TaxID=646526 RepID=A0A1W0E6S0_9MICR|nr:ATP-dependent (S)-NAD(P)H-hydrate dehydratase [Ecytonucleospora hepatopenaei]